MAAKSTNTPATPKTPSNTPEVQQLRDTILAMDNYSQHGFSQIEVIAKLALARLETPEGYNNIEDICVALEAIRDRSYEILNYINGEAGEVGCNYSDNAGIRRIHARVTREKKA